MALPKSVVISEEGPREGFQFEKQWIATEKKVALIDALSKTGLKHIQCVSFVSPKRVAGMADADEVMRLITEQPGIEYSAIWFNETGLQRALALGNRLTLAGKLRGYASDAFLMRNLNRTREEHQTYSLGEIARYKELGIAVTEASVTAAFGCNFSGDVSVERLLMEVAWLKTLIVEHSLPVKSLSLADTMAWATPASIKKVAGAVQERFPEFELSLHLHDTRGMGIANAYAGLEMGITHFDAAIGGLGGCPFAAHKGAAGNVCTEDLVFMCHEMGIETGLDLEALIECGQLAEEVVGHPLPGAIKQGGSLNALRRSVAA